MKKNTKKIVDKSPVEKAEKQFLVALEDYSAKQQDRINKTFNRVREMYLDRESRYGAAEDGFTDIAGMWSIILQRQVTPAQVSLCMIALKLCRESYGHTSDNIDDIHGYAIINELLNGART